MTQNSDTNRIEADLARERASLASTLNELGDRTSVESLASDAMAMIRNNAASYTNTIDQAVRANPMALALTGVGLAWLIFGGGKKHDKPAPQRPIARWEDEGGARPGYHPRHQSRYRPHDIDDDAWWERADEERRHASGLMDWIETQARSLRDSASDGIDQARDYAEDRAKVMADFASNLQNALSHGLDDLSEEARNRILAIRKKAYGASLSSTAADVRRQTGRVIEDHPMVVAAVVMALGAALASALPRSSFEDRTFGAESDALMDEARRTLRHERDRVSHAASDMMHEVKDVAEAGLEKISEDARRTADQAQAAVKDALHKGAESGAKGPGDRATPQAKPDHAKT